ncbi:MAG: alkaline phosphatase family protein [Planctomycetota bacterium]
MTRSALVFTTAALLSSGHALADPHVLVFTIDGLRPDAMEAASTPFIDALIANGTYSSNSTTSDLTFSGPGQTDVLTGVHRDQHGAVTNSTSDNPSEADPQFQIYSGSNMHNTPDFLAIANAAQPSLQTARFTGGWNPAHTTRSPGGSEYTFVGSDAAATANAAAYYGNNANDAQVGFIYLAEPDYSGHANGFHPNVTAYTDRITQTDAEIGSVITAIQGRENFLEEDWVFIIAADHGGSINGGHSGNAVWQREVPFIVSGNSVRNGELGFDAKNVDAAATALTHLGIALPSYMSGHAIGLNSVADPRPTLGLGHNLVFNGDAEYDRGFTDHGMDQAVSGWEEFRDADFINETSSRNGGQTATILQYGTSGGFPDAGNPGPSNRGDNFFSAGAGSTSSEMFQQIDISAMAAQIDAGQIDFDLSGYLGGFSNQNDRSEFFVRFLDANGSELATSTVGTVTNSDRGDQTGLLLREADGTLASGTRIVEVVLTTTGNDGYADNLSFSLDWTLTGDINADGLVGVEDLDVLLANWGDSVTRSSLVNGDLDGDGVVGQGDLDAVLNNWSDGTPPDVNVPEPGSLALLALGGMALLRRRR